MSGKDIYILSQMLPGNIWTDPLSVAVYTNKFSIRQFARERGGKCFKIGELQRGGFNYRLKVDLLQCNWGPVHIKCRAGTRLVHQVQVYCASTHQSPGGKNRPEILKFQDGEDEIGLKKSVQVEGMMDWKLTRLCCPALPPRPHRNLHRSPPPRSPTGEGWANHQQRTDVRPLRTA